MRFNMYMFGAILTVLGMLAFRFTGRFEDKYINFSNKVSPTEMQIKNEKKFKKYLKIRKVFLIIAGLSIVVLSMFVYQ